MCWSAARRFHREETRTQLSSLLGRGWNLYRANFSPLVGLFACVYLVVGTIPFLYLLAPRSAPVLVIALLLQGTLPVAIGSIGISVATIFLRRREEGSENPMQEALQELRRGKRAIVPAGLLAAAVATALAMLSFRSWPFVIALSHGLFGPPLIAQAVALEERANLTIHIRRLRETGKGKLGRAVLPLVNVVIATTLIAMVVLGAFAFAAVEAPFYLSAGVGTALQVAVMALLVGFLAAVEYEIYRAVTAPSVAIPD